MNYKDKQKSNSFSLCDEELDLKRKQQADI